MSLTYEKFQKSTKLDPWFVGPFEIIKKKSSITYKLALPPSLSKMHDVFYASKLKMYVAEHSHVLDFSN